MPVTHLPNIEYSRPDAHALLLDAWIPAGQGPFPAAVLVHGGAWVTGDRLLSVEPLLRPVVDAGIATFSISYRLADIGGANSLANAIRSATIVNDAVEDVRQAVRYVRSHAAEYKVDPSRIALIGESAGAQLASMAALRPNGMPPVQGVVSLYGPSDLGRILDSAHHIPPSVRAQFKGTPFETMLINVMRDLSPITWVHASAPPFLLIHGTHDAIVPFAQSEAMCQALRNCNVPCELITVEGAGHGMRRWEPHPAFIGYKAVMVDWLRKRL